MNTTHRAWLPTELVCRARSLERHRSPCTMVRRTDQHIRCRTAKVRSHIPDSDLRCNSHQLVPARAQHEHVELRTMVLDTHKFHVFQIDLTSQRPVSNWHMQTCMHAHWYGHTNFKQTSLTRPTK